MSFQDSIKYRFLVMHYKKICAKSEDIYYPVMFSTCMPICIYTVQAISVHSTHTVGSKHQGLTLVTYEVWSIHLKK